MLKGKKKKMPIILNLFKISPEQFTLITDTQTHNNKYLNKQINGSVIH